jgi:YidC/Oxa1 family membrane protein insertase
MDRDELRNWVVFAVLAVAILGIYQVFVYGPQNAHRLAELRAQSAAQAQMHGAAAQAAASGAPGAFLPLNQAAAASPRVTVSTPSLAGSIALRGARIDDLYLRRYHMTTDPKSPLVELFRPEGAQYSWFAEMGWTGSNVPGLPDDHTVWTAPAGAVLTPTTPVVLTYDNGAGLKFTRTISVDPNYMFSIADTVTNAGTAPVSLAPQGLVAQVGQPATLARSSIVHEGAIGMLAHNLVLDKYADWKKKTEPTTVASTGGWLGITEKYWLAALIPDQTQPITGSFQVVTPPGGGPEVYEASYAGAARTIAPGASITENSRLFAGAKVVPLLRSYEYSGTPPKYYWSPVTPHPTDIPRFDQAVDWGHLFFFTQPLFDLLELFTLKLGSVGLAILALTVVVRGIFFPLANKSYESMSKMKKIQPMVEELKKKFGEDQTKLQQETMALYQREKINPLMGCLPMLIQIPVFYSLYKVLTVTIEMRQAPFFGWIHDLSARDPSSIWTLFGLIHWNPALVPLIGGYLDGPLHIGLLPLIYGFTMWLSTSMSPPAGDPTTQKMMQFLPLIFTFTLAQVTVGLLIYWTWSNLLTILQQYVIMHRFKVENPIDNLVARFAKPKPRPSG